MIEYLLAAALGGAPPPTGWPADCDKVGDMYFQAAMIRDHGPKAGLIVEESPGQIDKVLQHVHLRKDLTPAQWKQFAIGVCAAEAEAEATEVELSAMDALPYSSSGLLESVPIAQ